jgi:ABC-type glycerol-3-phosphate transport system permease component
MTGRCSQLGAFLRVVLPVSKLPVTTTWIFRFLLSWSDLLSTVMCQVSQVYVCWVLTQSLSMGGACRTKESLTLVGIPVLLSQPLSS